MDNKVGRDAAITALIAYPTIRDAASACGISEKTLHAWLNEADFAKQVKQAQETITRETIGRVLFSVGTAIDTLEEIMKDRANNASPRVSAARAILDHSLRVYELQTVQERRDDLERRLNV